MISSVSNSQAASRFYSQPADKNTESKTASDPQNATGGTQKSAAGNSQLSETDLKIVQQLKKRDTEVRAHELAHLAAAAGIARSGASFDYQLGPDGVSYAVGGEVNIDTSPVPGNPEATLRKAQIVKSAALAPAQPSTQDFQVASSATAMAIKAISELATMAKQGEQAPKEKGAMINVTA